jgi:hypothetical protein
MPRSLLISIVCALSAIGCDSVERVLDGVAAPLKEPELPNCSRVLTCCANLSGDRALGPLVASTCEVVTTPTDVAIVRYQQARKVILDNTTTTQQTKDELLTDLRQTSQATLEPACRCLIDQTVGNISLDGYLSPLDCEIVASTGTIPNGKTCDDLTGAILSPQQ